MVLAKGQNGIKLAPNESINDRSKRIDMVHGSVCRFSQDGNIILDYTLIDEMVADMLTNAHNRVHIETLRHIWRLRSKWNN